MKFSTIGWSYGEYKCSFEDKMRRWADEHQNAEIVDVSYKMATNSNGVVINMYAFILYREP